MSQRYSLIKVLALGRDQCLSQIRLVSTSCASASSTLPVQDKLGLNFIADKNGKYCFISWRQLGQEMSKEYATGCNIFKDGEDPKLLPDDEYPAWLWHLIKPPLSTKQIHQKIEQVGYEGLPHDEFRRLQKLERKERIKAANRASRKK